MRLIACLILLTLISAASTGLALGRYDLSGSAGTENLTTTSPIVQNLETDTGSTFASAMAPQVPATQPGTSWRFTQTSILPRRIFKG